MYKENACVHTINVEKPVLGMRFGQYGREDNTLCILHGKGALTIKIWKRANRYDALKAAGGPPPEQDIPIAVPKKTKLYVEQLQREKDQGADIHRLFQRDLCKLRLETARAYVKVLTDVNMVSDNLTDTGGNLVVAMEVYLGTC
jgi:Bardet-Biedl syndrome 1 protein